MLAQAMGAFHLAVHTAVLFLRFPLGRTHEWIAFADSLTRIAG